MKGWRGQAMAARWRVEYLNGRYYFVTDVPINRADFRRMIVQTFPASPLSLHNIRTRG